MDKQTQSACQRTSIFLASVSLAFLSTVCVLLAPDSVHAVAPITSGSDWQSGTLEGVEATSTEGEIKLEPTGSWGAQSWKTPDKPLSIGSAFTSDGTDIYVFRGAADITFWKYSPTSDSWTTLANSPRGTYYGADLQYHSGYVYAMFGGYQKAFARYSIANNSWETLSDFPSFIYSGGSLTTDGTYLYGIPGNSSQEFYRYNIATNVWSPLAPSPLGLGAGADLTRIGDYIYTPRGANTTTFYRYSISAGTWTTMAVVPATLNDTIDITNDGTNVYVSRQTNTTAFYRYNVAANTWTTLTTAPSNSQYAGVQYHTGDGVLYFFRGFSDYRFWKYDIGSNAFVGPTEAPATLATGSDMLYYDNELYVIRGSNTTTLNKYTPSTNTWSAALAVSPATFNDDTKGVVAGSTLYFLRGGSTGSFYSYTPGTNTWATLASSPATTAYGAGLAYPGTGDYIYATRGLNSNTFWRYSISTNTWDTGVAAIPTGNIAHYGARLISDGTDIFFTAGLGQKRMFKYNIGLNTWTELAALPFSPYYGTDLAYNNGKIVAVSGWYKKDVYEYSIASDSWRKLKSFAPYGPTEVGAWAGASIEYSASNSTYYVTIGGTRQEILSYSPGANNFVASGTWTSTPLDFQHVASWTSITTTQTTPGDSSVSYQTRSSADGNSWSSWQAVVGTTIASPAQRYLQIKATLSATTGHTLSPSVLDIAVSAAGDTTDPANPASFTGLSQLIGGDPLVSGSSYPHTHPYFSWTESTDTESAIAGYYVYFGSNASADPTDPAVGTFQSGTTFQTNSVLNTGTHYLRVATKDAAGNISTPVTGFIYDYVGVSPPSTTTVTTSAEFSGTATNVTTTGDKVQLAANTNGFWLEERLTSPAAGIQWGGVNAVYLESSDKLYAFAGAGNTTFNVYSVSSDTWTTLAPAPATVSFGGGLVEGPEGFLYAARGNGFTDFWRYNINLNTWDTTIPSAPLTISYGSSMVYDGSQYIYITRGSGTDTFWRYDTNTDEWNTLAPADFDAPSNNVNNVINRGGDLAIDRTNGLIYATQGNYLKGFSVYNINTGVWTVLPDTPTLSYDGSALEYDAATDGVYYTAGASTPYFFKYDVSDQEWTQLGSAPATLLYGAGLNRVGDSLYVIRGGSTTNFYKYNITKNSWLIPTRGLFGRVFDGASTFLINSGADILKGDGDNFYVTRGNYADDFIRWNQTTGEMTRLANLPAGIFTGSSLVYDSTRSRIYLSGGIYDRNFYYYDIATNTWTRETNDPPPIALNAGSSLVYDGTRYIYSNLGGNTTTFYRFDILGSSGAKWSTMAVIPGATSNGAELLLKDGYIYTLRGANVAANPFYRYNIGTNTWSTMASFPTTVNSDGFLVDGNDGYFYAGRGIDTNHIYRYSVTENSWSQIDNAPAQVNTGAAAESNLLDKIYMLAGVGTNSYQDALYTYVLQGENSGFLTSGTYLSPTHDLTNVYKWANLTVNQTVAGNTGLTIETRSSTDNSTWTDWLAVSQQRQVGTSYVYKINSNVGRYLQLRFSFKSSDGIHSAVLSDYSINYYQDALAPTNPLTAGLTAFSQQTGGAPILSDTWYNHPAPYFVWPEAEATNGASDTATGSGVAGYYVYFGSTASADPSIDGTYQTGNTFVPSSVAASTTNYLRIQTVDAAGNVAATVWEPFLYKYDADVPSAPTNLAADPAGYSSTNSFDFSWNEVLEGAVPAAAYCYKTGASTGPYAVDQCTTELSITAVPSYQVGTNTFSVRARDQAGNYSPYTSVSYFYADIANAPAPPTNLALTTPATNSVNSFGFSWDVPAVFLGSAVNLSYRFSVNAIPTAQSTTATSLRYLNPGAYATLPGENVFYIVAQDEAGNINYSNYAQISFFANTVAPGIPLDVEIADVSVKNTASWRLALSWDPPEASGSGVSKYAVYRSTDGSTFTQISTTSSESYVDTRLSQVTYYYKVKACDDTNNCGEYSSVVELLPDGRYTSAAELIAEPVVSGVTTHKATISWSTGRTSDSKIAYGTGSHDYFDEEVASSDPVTSHVLTLNNLSPGTTYYFTAKWTDEDGNTGSADELSFSTLPPPSTEEPIAKNVGLTTAQIEFVTRNASKVKLYYGETSAFGGIKEIVTSSVESTQLIELEDLKDATKYYYKINTLDVDGTEYEGEIHSFETLPRPLIDDILIQQIQGTAKSTLLIRWTSNTPISSIVTYYPTAAPALAIDEVNITLTAGSHQMILFNLSPQTQYSIIIRGKDLAGNEAISEVQQILTSADTRPPQVTDLKVESEIIGTGEEATAQMIVSYKTDEPATSQVEYGEGTGTVYSQKTQESGTLTDNHLVIVSGLAPGKVYHLRSLSKDSAGNLAESIDKVVVTPKATENALDLVVSNLTGIFSFLRK